MIEPFRKSNGSVDDIEYQFLHRTASACFETKGQATVIYQLFYNERTKDNLSTYKDGLANYVRLLDPKDNLKFYIWEIEVTNILPTTSPFEIMQKEAVYTFGKENINLINT
jgi:hypothetical protein